jgi:hypothetical protein
LYTTSSHVANYVTLGGIMNWTKYSYVCTSCDSLIEVTSNAVPVLDPGCVCGLDTFVVRTALEPEQLAPVISVTSNGVVKINTNPYN